MASITSSLNSLSTIRHSNGILCQQLALTCADGLTLAAQSWTSKEPPQRQILCWHGWMDNSNTFHLLAPKILEKMPSTQIVCVDFPGHGQSSHKSIDGPPSLFAESVFYVAEAVRLLELNMFTYIGHSMGAAVGCMYAAAFPVEKLVLLDGAGPLARKTTDIAKHLRQHVNRRQHGLLSTKQPRIYPSFEAAVETRQQTARLFPGNQSISQTAAAAIVRRGSIPLENNQVQFRHDPRLQWPSIQYMNREQVNAIYAAMDCPTALITAQEGWPVDEEIVKDVQTHLQPAVHVTLPGSHHFHADPDTVDSVVNAIVEFLEM